MADIKDGKCKTCGRAYKWDSGGETSHHSPDECRGCYDSRRRKERKERLLDEVYEYDGCKECGYDECIRALSFHHRDPEEKSFKVSSSGLLRAWDDVVEEAEKCDVLCANCHQKHHCEHC